MKKFFIIILALFSISLLSCESNNDKNQNNENSNNNINEVVEWKNDQAVYVTINKEYRKEVLENLSNSFKEYEYKKIYLTEKHIYDDGSIYFQLLFIINCDLEKFTEKLSTDKRVEYFSLCKDLPYDSFDNRYLQYECDEINVGDSLTISLVGDCDIYSKPFEYNSIYVTPINYDRNKVYTTDDFPNIQNIDYIYNRDYGLVISLKDSNYFELIKTIDLLANDNDIKEVEVVWIDIVRPIWEISNNELVSYVINNDDSITITALKPGMVILNYDGFECQLKISKKL